jgi:hypothetical protein
MSYDISLNDPVTNEVIELDSPHQMRGGTYCLGGTKEAALNVTYNYCSIFKKVFGDRGIRTIYGKTGAESILMFQQAIDQLSDDVSEDYWKATEGNAKVALLQLKAIAQLRPDGIWDGD